MNTQPMPLLTWAQCHNILDPVLSLYEIEDHVNACVVNILMGADVLHTLVDARYAADAALRGFDDAITRLRAARKALAVAVTPPQVMICHYCTWVGTTHEAGHNEDDDEYRCPDCGSGDDIFFFNVVEATAAVAIWRQSDLPVSRHFTEHTTATLAKIAAWRFGQPAAPESPHVTAPASVLTVSAYDSVPVWTVVGAYDAIDSRNPRAAIFVEHGYGQTAVEGQQDALTRLVADWPNHLTDPDAFDADYDPRDELAVLAVFPGRLFDVCNAEPPTTVRPASAFEAREAETTYPGSLADHEASWLREEASHAH